MKLDGCLHEIDRVFINGLSTWIPCDRGSFRRLESHSPHLLHYSWTDDGWKMEFTKEAIIGVGRIDDQQARTLEASIRRLSEKYPGPKGETS